MKGTVERSISQSEPEAGWPVGQLGAQPLYADPETRDGKIKNRLRQWLHHTAAIDTPIAHAIEQAFHILMSDPDDEPDAGEPRDETHASIDPQTGAPTAGAIAARREKRIGDRDDLGHVWNGTAYVDEGDAERQSALDAPKGEFVPHGPIDHEYDRSDELEPAL
jgi:hypothetical protein